MDFNVAEYLLSMVGWMSLILKTSSREILAHAVTEGLISFESFRFFFFPESFSFLALGLPFFCEDFFSFFTPLYSFLFYLLGEFFTSSLYGQSPLLKNIPSPSPRPPIHFHPPRIPPLIIPYSSFFPQEAPQAFLSAAFPLVKPLFPPTSPALHPLAFLFPFIVPVEKFSF